MKKILPIQRRLDGVEQRIFAERLAQEIHCTSGDSLPPFVLGPTGGDHLLALLCALCPKPRLTRAGIKTLQSYDWPGNIRELRNVIERAVICARSGALEFDLPVNVSSVDLTPFGSQDTDGPELEYLTESEMRRRERENLLAILQKTGWKIKGVGGAAELLGVSPTTLFSRIKKMGFKQPMERTQEPVL